jgi:hypothetical protein
MANGLAALEGIDGGLFPRQGGNQAAKVHSIPRQN